MAKRKSGRRGKNPRIVSIGPKPDKMVYFLRQIRQHEASIKNLEREIANEKDPVQALGFLVSMQRYRINLCNSRIKLFKWFLSHGGEIGREPNETRVKAAISRQKNLIGKARGEIDEARQRGKLKLRRPSG